MDIDSLFIILGNLPDKENTPSSSNNLDARVHNLSQKLQKTDLKAWDKVLDRHVRAATSKEDKQTLSAKIRQAVAGLEQWKNRKNATQVEELQEHLRAFDSQIWARNPLPQTEIDRIVAYVAEHKDSPLRKNKTGLPYTLQLRGETIRVLGPEIGRGSFSRVRETLEIKQGSPVHYYASKTAKPAEDTPKAWAEARRQFAQELEFLPLFKGKRGVIQVRDHTVTELREGGEKGRMVLDEAEETLYDLMLATKIGTFPTDLRQQYMLDLLYGLTAVHQAKIAHLDVNFENIFLVGGEAKLGDFGSAVRKKDEMEERPGGKKPYMSPEMIELSIEDTPFAREMVGTASDIFSLGMLFYEMKWGVAIRNPADDFDEHYEEMVTFCDRVAATETEDPEGQLILKMLSRDTADRPTAEAALQSLLQILSSKY